ncbi:hypothetical protein MLD38_033548 [Melastoma candidum]|uniref:Uncharacterized protein n=1 Tax=Melastoma candidum TaxID=119954 RepID=A0ACB9M8Y2_9MYRT|nr:hypothetical protein MLD38_033548 [Melastoma candidum]
MGNHKQQVISRFFSPKPQPHPAVDPSSQPPPPPPPAPPSSRTSPAKVAAVVQFSPYNSKRRLSSLHRESPPTPPVKKPRIPKLSPHTHNPVHTLPSTSKSCLVDQKAYTPLEQQVLDLKSRHPDVLLMVEVGYKYRFFGEDAETAANVLGIYAHMSHNFVTASIPTFRLNVHLRRLVNAGYKVGVVKQTETATIKSHGPNKCGPFSRGLSALYTKATLEAAEGVGEDEERFGGESNYLMCIVEEVLSAKIVDGDRGIGDDVRIGFVGVEMSAGEVVYGELGDDTMRSRLESVMLSLSPVELIVCQPVSSLTKKFLSSYVGSSSSVRIEEVVLHKLSCGNAREEMMKLYETMSGHVTSGSHLYDGRAESAFKRTVEVLMHIPDLAVQALVLIVRHLSQFGFEKILCLGESFKPYSGKKEMILSGNALQQLEILRNNHNGSEAGSLLQIMNNTLTIYGSRLLRHWVTHPLCDRNMIAARLDAVAEIAESVSSSKAGWGADITHGQDDLQCIKQPELNPLLSSVLTHLSRCPDLQRGITRIFYRTATAKEFIAVVQAILYTGKQLQPLIMKDSGNGQIYSQSLQSNLLRRLVSTVSSSSLIAITTRLLSVLNFEAADQGDLSSLIIGSDSQFPEVVRCRQAVQLAKDNLDSLISSCRKQVGRRNLEFITVSGITHLLELPVEVKVPLNWVKVNSTKKTVRYHPPEVSNALDQLTLANEELAIACRAAWLGFLEEFGSYYSEFQASVQALAALDCLYSLAVLSKNKSYIRPVLLNNDDPAQIEIRSGRHPVLETLLHDSFVPNDTNLHANRESCQIITGPNMGGKSCYIRQVALIVLMAQVGSFVPAVSAKLHVSDGIYTRMGATDSIQQGRSTFLEELSEASHIIHNCTPHSLVIIDELGRGTSTHDGVAIAYSTLHYLLEMKRCMILFVTHYPQIADIRSEFPGSVGAYHVSYLTTHKDVAHEDVTYLYKLKSGVSGRSFGLKVAELAQIPPACVSRAGNMASKLEIVMKNRSRYRSESTIDNNETATGKVAPILNTPDRVDGSNKLTPDYEEFFFTLKSALAEDDLARSYSSLLRARNLAKQLTMTTW